MITIVAVLLAVEIVADKVPALDSVNDTAVTDPGDFASTGQWVPVAIGVVTALVVHLTKTAVRPAANVATAGTAAPVLSTLEDITSVGLIRRDPGTGAGAGRPDRAGVGDGGATAAQAPSPGGARMS